MTKKGKRVRKQKQSRRRKQTTIPIWVWLVIVGTVFVFAGVGLAMRQSNNMQAAVLAGPDVLARGEAIYNETCVACHGPEGEGNVGPALNGSMHAWHHVDNQLRSFIRDGIDGTAMVGHKDHLSDEEIDAVISYIKVWWTPEQRQMQLTGRHPMP